MMELTDLRYFVNVASCESFVRGAALSGVSAPAVSKTVSKLEAHLGVELFARTTRSVVLTEAGRLLLRRCHHIFTELDELKADLSDLGATARGPVRIAAMEVFSIAALPAALSRVVRKQPEVRPLTYEMIPQQMETLVGDGSIDVGFTIGAGRDKLVQYEELGRSEGVLVCGRDHALWQSGRISANKLKQFAFVAPSFYGKQHLPSLDQFPSSIERTVSATIELLQMGLQLAVNGTHLGYFPKVSAYPRIATGELKVLKGLPKRPPFLLHALTRKGARKTLATTLIVEAVRKEIQLASKT